MALFGNNGIKSDAVLMLSTAIIANLFSKAPLLETRQATLIRILEQIAKRREGLPAIFVLRSVLPRVFGVNVLAADSACGIVDAWLAQASRRPFA
jgi:hypothetical protein